MPRLSPGRASCEREDAGVTRTIERTHSEAPRAPVIVPAGSMPRPPGERGYKPRPQEPHSLRVQVCLEATSHPMSEMNRRYSPANAMSNELQAARICADKSGT